MGKNILVLSNSGPMVPVAAKSLQGEQGCRDGTTDTIRGLTDACPHPISQEA